MLILMSVPLAFSLLNRSTHNLPLEAPLIYIPSLVFIGYTFYCGIGRALVLSIQTLSTSHII